MLVVVVVVVWLMETPCLAGCRQQTDQKWTMWEDAT